MLNILPFTITFGIMMFIWTFVYLNKSKNKINQSFLIFLSTIIVWMVLSVSDISTDTSIFGILLKTLYFYSMLNMAPAFLFFIYRLVRKKLDLIFYSTLALNTSTIILRYFFPIDYQDPTFWRLDTPIVAPLMSAIFTLPIIISFVLIIKYIKTTKDEKLKNQLKNLLLGTAIACIISVFSEYVFPVKFDLDLKLSLMYIAILVFVVCAFISVYKFKFLSLQVEYIYRKMFLNYNAGIIIVNKHNRIVGVNDMAKEILQNKRIEPGEKISKYISEYDFNISYKNHEVCVIIDGNKLFLSLTQNPIDPDYRDSEKLLVISDITNLKIKHEQEKGLLLKKSEIDTVTGLYNKQYFLENFYKPQEKFQDKKLTLLFIDIDNFKNINDSFGHLYGDKVLKAVAQLIKCEIGENGIAVRFGGDEFMVLFEDISLDEAYKISETIRNKISATEIDVDKIKTKIALSIGIAEGYYPIESIIIKADKAMYQSKEKGRNRTTVFSENKSE